MSKAYDNYNAMMVGRTDSRVGRIVRLLVRMVNEIEQYETSDASEAMNMWSQPISQYQHAEKVSKVTAWRDVKLMEEHGLIEVKDVKAWRPKASQYWYGLTEDGLIVARALRHELSKQMELPL